MHLAILGGSFNPVHYGHLRGALEALEATGADRVLFIPTALTPHKEAEVLLDAQERLTMLRLATGGNPAFVVSDIEVARGGKSYTVETLKQLKASYNPEPELSLVIGSDSFNEISSWHSYAEIFKLANVVVFKRPGHRALSLKEALSVELEAEFCYDSIIDVYTNNKGRSIRFIDSTELNISSTRVRELVSEGKNIRYLVPFEVAGYIEEVGLYK